MAAGEPISRTSLRDTCIAMLVLTTICILARIGGGYSQWRQLQIEDLWLVLCYAFFVTVAVLYMYVLPAFYRLSDLGAGAIEPYPTVDDDGLFIQKGLFAASACLWFCLWSAKFSLLCMYKRLLDQLPTFVKLWWALVIFSFLALVGCIITLLTACSSMYAWFSVGNCYTPRDIVHAAISMWYAYAVDVLTDLLIMALPLRLLIGLQMPRSRKAGVAGLFSLGFVCIIASTIRVSQIQNGAQQPTVPWLALWGTVESAIAVIIASGPGLYRILKMHTSRKQYYAAGGPSGSRGPSGYGTGGKSAHSRGGGPTIGGGGGGSSTGGSKSRHSTRVQAGGHHHSSRGTDSDEIDLKTFPMTSVSRAAPGGSNSSQEDLVPGTGRAGDVGGGGIMVTRTLNVHDGGADSLRNA